MEWLWAATLFAIILILLLSPPPGRSAAPERPPFPTNPAEREGEDLKLPAEILASVDPRAAADYLTRVDRAAEPVATIADSRRFLLFSGYAYYPIGGAEDYRGAFASLGDAMAAFNPSAPMAAYDWAHVFDTSSEMIVAEVWIPHAIGGMRTKDPEWKVVSAGEGGGHGDADRGPVAPSITDAELARLGAGIRTWLPSDDHDTWARVLQALGREEARGPSTKSGCGAKLAEGQWWSFCGETDMGQSLPALCTNCGGGMKLAPGIPIRQDDEE